MTCTEERFYNDVAHHEMTIVRDDGLDRHLKFRASRGFRNTYWFDIVTWPGVLVINGDMGTWAFSRTPDMFAFFRMTESEQSYAAQDGKTLAINPSYWAEKINSRDKHSDVEVFSSDVFAREVKRRYVEHVRENMRDMPEHRKELRRQLENLIDEHPEGSDEREAIAAACNFHYRAEYRGTRLSAYSDGRPSTYRWADFNLEDFWESNCREYSHHFIWNLYAIVWGIWHYDQRNEYADFWRRAA